MNILLEIAKKRQKKGSGSQLLPISSPQTSILVRILTVPYAVVGEQATKSYTPERHTLDWDILINKEDIKKTEEELKSAGAHTFRPLNIDGFSCLLSDNTSLDVITSDEKWCSQALADSLSSATPQTDPVITLPWLVLLKLQASHVQDLADISRMIARADDPTQHKTREIIKKHLPDAIEDLDSLIELGKLEL